MGKIKDLLKRFIDQYRMPMQYLPQVEDRNMARVMCLGIGALIFGLFNIITIYVTSDYATAISANNNVRYFLGFVGFGLFFTVAGRLLWHSRVSLYIKGLVAYMSLAVAASMAAINSFTSNAPLNSFLAFSAIYVLCAVFLDIDPFATLLITVVPFAFIASRVFAINGLASFMDVVLVTVVDMWMAFYRRRIGTANYLQREQLEEAYEHARSADEAKSAFLAHMSHEIRTPINAIVGMDEMILRESLPESVEGYAVNIQKASSTLLSLINDILDFSKIEAGKMEIIPVEYDLNSILSDCYNMVLPRAEDKGIILTVENNPQIPRHLYGDELRIRQIIINIMTNGVKYTDSGTVTLRVDYKRNSADRLTLVIAVEDTGTGIARENIDSLFDSFQRFDEINNRHIEGTGLGLAITKRLIEAQNGDIHIDSELGKGSTFTVCIPQEILSEDPVGNFQDNVSKTERNNFVYRESFHAPEAHILIVDDVKMNLDVFKALLKKTRVQIDDTTRGRLAVEMGQGTKYDIIFIDQMMPEMDGAEVLKAMTADVNYLNYSTPKVVITANLMIGMDDKYKELGFDDYVPKPVESAKLEALILRLLPEDKIVKGVDDTEAAGDPGDSIDALPKIEGIKWRDAYNRLESMDILLEAVNDVTRDAEKTVDVIRGYYDSYVSTGDSGALNNYMIKVHALKSSAGTIGAQDVQLRAKMLEDAARKGDRGLIVSKTDDLLTDWLELCDKLEQLMDSQTEIEGTEELEDASYVINLLQEVADVMENFDIDTARDDLRTVCRYRYDDEITGKLKELREAIDDVDDELTREIVECTVAILRRQYS